MSKVLRNTMKKLTHFLFDLVQLFLFFVRYLLHGGRRYPMQTCSLSGIDILGNGPSLKKYIDNRHKKDRDSLCVNFSPLTDEFYFIRPKYLVLIDPEFYNEENEKVKKLKNAIASKIDWNLKIITIISHLKKAKKMYMGDNIEFIGLPNILYNPKTKHFLKIKHKLFKWGATLPSAQNVAIAAIYVAINSGYKSIHLYGLEHSWLKDTFVTADNVVCLKDIHYYGTQNIPWAYNKDGSTWKMRQVLYALSLMFKGYDELRLYADYLGSISIINKTSESWIDAFERE